MSEETNTEENAATTAAARRRAAKGRPNAAEVAKAAEPLPEIKPDYPPPPTKPVIVSRAMVAQFAYDARSGNGITVARGASPDGSGFARPVPAQLPLIQPSTNQYGVTLHQDQYVRAEFDAIETMVPDGQKTAVSRVLWQKGWLIQRDLYAAVAKRTSPEDQAQAAQSNAKLPEGADRPPVEFVTEVASPILSAPPGAPA